MDAYNVAVRREATARGAALVDLDGLLETARTTGLRFQGTAYTSEFIRGGLFSLDGVHPTDLAQGFLCNALIEAVNAQFGARIPPVDLSSVATLSSSRQHPAFDGDGPVYPIIENAEALYRAMFGGRPDRRASSSPPTSDGGMVPLESNAVWKALRSKVGMIFFAFSRSSISWSLPTR